MKLTINVDKRLINRPNDELITIISDHDDTIDSIKVKITMLYTNLGTKKMNLIYNRKSLKNDVLFNTINYTVGTVIYATKRTCSCCLIF